MLNTRTDIIMLSCFLHRRPLQIHPYSLTRKTLAGAIRALELGALAIGIQALLADDMGAGHHHGGVGVGGLLLADGAHEDAMKDVGRRQRDGHGHLLGRGPVRPVDAHDLGRLGQQRQRDAPGRRGHEQRRLRRQPQQRAELFREGARRVVPRGVVVEQRAVRRLVDVLVERECAHQLADFGGVARLEIFEAGLGVLESE